MMNASIDDLYYRNRRIRDFMQKFREKDRSHIMRDITILGIELFEEMNKGITYFSAEDVENTLATFVIDRDRGKIRGNTHGNTISHAAELDPTYLNNEDKQTYNGFNRIKNTTKNGTIRHKYDLEARNKDIQDDTTENNIDLTGPGLPIFDANLIYDKNEQNFCRNKDKLKINENNKAVPAGIPSYMTFKNDEEEERVRQRSASKWRVGDDSVYEPKAPRIKISRTTTEDFEKQTKDGMNYPKWWGDNSDEKQKKHISSFYNKHPTETNFYQMQPGMSKSSNKLSRELDPKQRWINYDVRNPVEEAKFLLKDQRDQILKDKRLETRPRYEEPEHQTFTVPLKSSLRNSEGIKSRGGVALFYPMSEVGRLKNLDEYEDRPISPVRFKANDRFGEVEENTNEDYKSKERTKTHLYHNRRDFEKFSCSPKQNESFQKLHERDTEIALKRREKLESVRNKDKEQERSTYSRAFKNTKSKIGRSARRDRKNRSHASHFERRSQSPTGNIGCLKRRAYYDQRLVEGDDTFERVDEKDRKTFLSHYSELPVDHRDPYHRDHKHSKERIYYRQEDLMKPQYEVTNIKEENIKSIKEENESDRFGPRIEQTKNEIPSSPLKHDNVNADEVLNRHNNRLSEFGYALDRNQVYPYSKGKDSSNKD